MTEAIPVEMKPSGSPEINSPPTPEIKTEISPTDIVEADRIYPIYSNVSPKTSTPEESYENPNFSTTQSFLS